MACLVRKTGIDCCWAVQIEITSKQLDNGTLMAGCTGLPGCPAPWVPSYSVPCAQYSSESSDGPGKDHVTGSFNELAKQPLELRKEPPTFAWLMKINIVTHLQTSYLHQNCLDYHLNLSLYISWTHMTIKLPSRLRWKFLIYLDTPWSHSYERLQLLCLPR